MEEDQERNQKSIIELQHEISIYKNRELVYLVLYFLKSQQLKQLTLYKQNLVKEIESNCNNEINDYSNLKMLNDFNSIKKILKDKDANLLAKEEELLSLQTPNNKKNITIASKKLKNLQETNYEFLGYLKGNFIENMKQENAKERNQIEKLLLKLKDCEFVYDDFEKQIDEAQETIAFLNRKRKVNEGNEGESKNQQGEKSKNKK
jgi:hypothetical protein